MVGRVVLAERLAAGDRKLIERDMCHSGAANSGILEQEMVVPVLLR